MPERTAEEAIAEIEVIEAEMERVERYMAALKFQRDCLEAEVLEELDRINENIHRKSLELSIRADLLLERLG